MIRKLRVKFVLITMSMITIILAAVLAGICLFFAQSARQQSNMSLEIALNRPVSQNAPIFQLGGPPPEDFQRDPVFVLVISNEGQVRLVSSERIEVTDEDLLAIATAVLQTADAQGTLPQYNLRYISRQSPEGTMYAFIDVTQEKRAIGSIVVTCVGVGVLALAAFFAASLLLSRWVLKPVGQAWEQQRRFVTDASHELRTPLTVIMANNDILKAHPQDTVASQMKWVENTEQETRRMKGLVDDLLFLAKRDDVADALVLSSVNISDVVSHTALLFESKAYEQGISVVAEVPPGIETLGNEAQLKQLVGILLDNAIKYSEPGGEVAVRLKTPHQGGTQLTVHNDGPAIADEDRRHLFDRFYRADLSRAQEGYGLGLSIAQSIVQSHKGKITVESSEGKGTTFKVLLPKAE